MTSSTCGLYHLQGLTQDLIDLAHTPASTTNGDLDAALTPDVTQLIRRVVRSEMYRRTRRAAAEDIEDICSDAMVAVLTQLGENPTTAIENPEAYIASIARRACSAWARRRQPAFHRLRSRLRYLLKTSASLALWQNLEGEWLCGPAALLGTTNVAPLDDALLAQLHPDRSPLRTLLDLFDLAGKPVYFNDLTRLCAQLWAVQDEAETLEDVEISSPAVDVLSTLDYRERLKSLWAEVRTLPQRQCAALLLNLRVGDNDCAVSLLVMTATTTLDEIAEALGMTGEAFVELWPRLPLEDREIAGLLQATRQQIINLRKCARERLRRRTAFT